MCAWRHWFNWSVMLMMAAALFASLPPDCIFLSADGGPTRLSRSNPNVSLVIPKDDVDAGKISYHAVVPPSFNCVKEKKITLIGGIGGCRMDISWVKGDKGVQKFNLETVGSGGIMQEYGHSSFVSVDVFSNGTARLKNSASFQGCYVVSKPNNNTVQGGNVVDFSVENILQTCPDISIEFDERYKLYNSPGSLTLGDNSKNDNTALVIGLSVGGALLLLAAICFGLWCLWKYRTKNTVPAAPTDVKVVPSDGLKPKVVNNSPDMPKMTAISKTHVKTTQPKPTPEVKPIKAIPKLVPKLEPCPTEETDTPLPKVVISSKKKEQTRPMVVISSKKKKKPSRRQLPIRSKKKMVTSNHCLR